MSGGSYGYLCNKADEPERLVAAAVPSEGWDGGVYSECQLDQMTEALRGYDHPKAVDAAARTAEVKALVDEAVALLAKIRQRAEPLAQVWKAVEWHASCDYSKEDVFEALDAFKAGD